MSPTAVLGTSLVFLHALTLALLQSSLPGGADAQVVWGLVWLGLGLSAVIAVAGIAVDRRQSKARALDLQRTHELLDAVAASLESEHPTVELRESMEMDSYVERLARLVDQVQRVVDERQQREREVMRADQLAMVGQIAAGVAHELRNPLTSIKMLVQSGQKEGAPALAEEDLAIIEHEIRRLERSLQRFLDFARPPRPERQPLDLTRLVERALALVEGRARKQRVHVNFRPPPDAVIVEVDEDQIQQLLLNLMLNSLDVMPDGGSLSVQIASLPDGQAELRVRDTGPGIPAELLPRLFDPFISTKETGIGLGLAVSHRIAERHGGTLSAHNEPDGGACFVLRLAETKNTPAVV